MPGGNARARGRAEPRLRGDARAAGVAVAGLVLQGRPAPRAVARRGSETAAALGTELRVRFGAGAIHPTDGNPGTGNGRRQARGRPPFPLPTSPFPPPGPPPPPPP